MNKFKEYHRAHRTFGREYRAYQSAHRSFLREHRQAEQYSVEDWKLVIKYSIAKEDLEKKLRVIFANFFLVV